MSAWWGGGSSSWPPCSSSKLLVFTLILLISGFFASLNSKSSNAIFTISPKGGHFWQLSPFKFFGGAVPSSSSITEKKKKSPDSDFQSPPPSNGYASVSSSLPPNATEQQQPVERKEEKSNVTMAGNRTISPMNEPPLSQPTPRLEKEHSNLERLEVGLARSRAAIKEAMVGYKTHDPDYVPTGPVYWNANAFHRSYLEMEKQFKVYVYEEGDPPIFHNSACEGILGMEGIFINDMEISHFRTREPEKAHAFFLPFSIVSIVHYVYIVDSHDWSAMKNTAMDYVDVISQKYPYWNRSLGADHFMLACHDWGPEISKAVPLLYNTSIRALCNANTSENFHPSKDVSIPEIYLPKGTTEGLLDGPSNSPSKRPILVFFAGGIHGYIRAVLLEHWEKKKDKDVQIQQYLPKGVSYYDKMRKSRYCICASGWEVASPRMVEALYLGCVPVLIKDHYAAPFADVLNWNTFSVNVPVNDIPNLKKILNGIPQRQYIKMQRRGLQVRKHFEVNLPPKRYDVFHMILHSIWLRRLNLRIRDT